MNILLINSADNKGGATKTSWDLFNGLKSAGHEVSYFVRSKYISNRKIFEFPKSGWRSTLANFLATDIDFFQSDWLLSTKEYQRADVVNCHNIHGGYMKLATIARIAREKPLVWTMHDLWSVTSHAAHSFNQPVVDGFYQSPSLNTPPIIKWHNEKYLTFRKRRFYERQHFDIVVPSLWLKGKLEKSVLGDKPVQHIPYGIDTTFFSPGDKKAARKRLGLPLDKKIVLFNTSSGRKNLWKGVSYAETVAKYYRNSRVNFIFLGGKHQGSVSDGNITYLGYIFEAGKMRDYYRAADALILTSIAENLPYVILEAMSCGLPVVAFDVGGVKEEVEHKKTGYLVKYKNTKDLITGLDFIFHLSKSQKQEMADAARKKIWEQYSLRQMVKAYSGLFQSLV